jgi:hypothetical protein
MQVINPGESASGRLGTALGSGLSTGLQNLAQMKLQQIQQRQQQQHNQSALQALNFNPEQAKALSPLSDTLLKDIIKQQLSAPSNNLYNQALASAVRGGDISQQTNAQQATEATQSVNPSSNVANLIAQGNFKPQEAKQLADVELQRQQNKRAISKEAREYLAPYEERAIASRNNIRDYDLLQELAKGGDLRAGNARQLLDSVGLGEFNRNYETQLGDKIVARLAQNAQSAFGKGTRITNFLEKTFQRSLPSLWNTPEAIIGISEFNKLADQAQELAYQERIKIIEENNGEIPFNIASRVDKRIGKEIERIEKQAFDVIRRAEHGKTKPEKSFNDLPDASAYVGRKLRNKATGQIVTSDGQEWI